MVVRDTTELYSAGQEKQNASGKIAINWKTPNKILIKPRNTQNIPHRHMVMKQSLGSAFLV